MKRHKPIWNNLANDTRYFIITGGRGSGKSFEVGRFACLLSFEQGQKILFTRYVMTSAHLSVIPEFKGKIEYLGLQDHFMEHKTEITNLDSGTQIIFRGIKTGSGDQTANLKSLEGMTTWIMDEGEEMTEESIFDKIDLSIRKKGVQNRVIIILNPTTKSHWIYRRFFETAGIKEGFTGKVGDTTYIHTTYEDNIENLDESFLQKVEKIRVTDFPKYQHIILGGWLDKADGVIFKRWHYGEFDESLIYGYGMDFGFFDPDVLVKVAVDEKKMLLYVKLELYETGLSPTALKQRVYEIVGRQRTVIADCAEPRLINDIYNMGVNIVPVIKYPGSVLEGVKQMLDYEIIVHPDSTKIGEELNNYSEKNGEPIDAWNHTIDAIRYKIMKSKTNPINSRVLA